MEKHQYDHLNIDNSYDIHFFYGRTEPRLDLHITQVDEANTIYPFHLNNLEKMMDVHPSAS